MRKIILITGGQRSGKSSYAENLALSLCENPVYMATARVWDEEFRQRILRHQARRGSRWSNIEEEKMLSRHNVQGRVVVVDCLTLWCTNWFFDAAGHDGHVPDVDHVLNDIKSELSRFVEQNATFIFVTNEIGSGGTSSNAIQRSFTDLLGWVNQYAAQLADEVVLMVSGISVRIKKQEDLGTISRS